MSVYVISDGAGFVKIGLSSAPIQVRLKQLQCGNARTLRLLYSFDTYGTQYYDRDLEHTLHKRYAEYRVSHDNYGPSEWFRDDCLDDIAHLEPDDIHEMMRGLALKRKSACLDVQLYKHSEGRMTRINQRI